MDAATASLASARRVANPDQLAQLLAFAGFRLEAAPVTALVSDAGRNQKPGTLKESHRSLQADESGDPSVYQNAKKRTLSRGEAENGVKNHDPNHECSHPEHHPREASVRQPDIGILLHPIPPFGGLSPRPYRPS